MKEQQPELFNEAGALAGKPEGGVKDKKDGPEKAPQKSPKKIFDEDFMKRTFGGGEKASVEESARKSAHERGQIPDKKPQSWIDGYFLNKGDKNC